MTEFVSVDDVESLFPNNKGFAPDGRAMRDYIADYLEAQRSAAQGEVPSSDLLAKAPLLERWFMSAVRRPQAQVGSEKALVQIIGIFTGHPYIRDGTYGHTSPVLQIAEDQSWVRCASRLYRLGAPILETVEARPV